MIMLMFSSLLKYQLEKNVPFTYERWSFNRGSPVFFFKSHTSNGNNINVCLRLTYLSSMKGKHSTRRLIVKQIFAVTIKRFFFSQRKSPGNTPAFDSAHVI